MKIWCSPYQLQKIRGGFREGALLKIEFEPGFIGYADCHPWIEFGNMPLAQELDHLAQGRLSRLTERSLAFAKLDAEARAENKNWFAEHPIPESRLLMPEIGPIESWEQLGYRSFKFKISSPITPFLQPLSDLATKHRSICLDANESLTLSDFEHLFSLFPDILYEDPVPYDPVLWKEFQQKGARLAADKNARLAAGFPESAQVLVIKPAIQDLTVFQTAAQQELFITSYLDHPVGQLCAAKMAAIWAPHSLCGIATHHNYLPTAYSEALGAGPYLKIPHGTGLGFNKILEKEPWEVVFFS